MRVGNLAKGLLLSGDNHVCLVVLCAEKPTRLVGKNYVFVYKYINFVHKFIYKYFLYRSLLNKVAEILPAQLKIVAPEDTYNVGKHPESAALTVSGGSVTVSVTLTSPLMRETPKPAAAAGDLIVLYFHSGQEKDN